jgi:hypothetical protein
MHELPLETAIWNRACAGGAASFLTGDRALSNILMAHGFVMNGGVLHAVECLSDVQFADALAGYRFYDLHSAAAVMIRQRRF